MISLGSIRTEKRDGETVIPDEEEDKLLAKLADKLTEKMGNKVEVRSEKENAGLEDIWLAGQPLGKIVESNRKTAKSAEKQARAAESSDSKTTDNDGENRVGEDKTTLERIADEDEENPAGVRIRASIERAATVMKHWKNWSKKAPKGRNIREGLRTLLETATGESLVWRQVYRACTKVEQLTKGKIVFFKHKKYGWMLLQPDKRASSAGHG